MARNAYAELMEKTKAYTRAAHQMHGESVALISYDCRINPNTYYGYERGASIPTLRVLMVIQERTKLNLDNVDPRINRGIRYIKAIAHEMKDGRSFSESKRTFGVEERTLQGLVDCVEHFRRSDGQAKVETLLRFVDKFEKLTPAERIELLGNNAKNAQEAVNAWVRFNFGTPIWRTMQKISDGKWKFQTHKSYTCTLEVLGTRNAIFKSYWRATGDISVERIVSI